MKRYPKLRYPSDSETKGLFEEGEVIIQEKLDGSNFRVTSNNNELMFGSRRTFADSLHRDQFKRQIQYIEDKITADQLEPEWVLFGEGMNPHTLSYNFDSIPPFIGFDVWDSHDKQFLPTDESAAIFEELGFIFSPVIDVVPVEEWEDYNFEVPESKYGDVLAEGVVFKNHETNTYAKYVRDEFKEKAEKTFGSSKKNCESGADRLIRKYVPNQRIKKAIYRLRDEEGKEIRMELMEDGLAREVINDLVKEEGVNIFMGENWEIDLGEVRSNISSRCASVLRREVDKKMTEVLNN